MNLIARALGAFLAIGAPLVAVLAFKSTSTLQTGNDGVGMQIVDTKVNLEAKVKANTLPYGLPPASHDGPLAVDSYKNVKVLGHLSSAELTRLMTQITIWVAPNDGCGYCHAPERDKAGAIVKNEEGYAQADLNKMDSDELYTKRVARRMFQMTMYVNGNWKRHVKDTGVTCYTCHRGNPVPTNIWYTKPPNEVADLAMGDNAGQNSPSPVVGTSSLPNDPYDSFFLSDVNNVSVNSLTALPTDDHSSIKQAEFTFGLMVNMSNALGVNCTYCHNMRAPQDWSQSPPTREQAWQGIRMVRDLNNSFLVPLQTTFPANRLGPTGDSPKLNCATCHQGAFKPLLGVSMLPDNMVLAEAKPQPMRTVAATEAAPVTTAVPAAVVVTDAGAVELSKGTSASDAGADGGGPRTQPRSRDAGK